MNKVSRFLFAGMLACGISNSIAGAVTAKPLRVGPVQNYGALGTSGSKIVSLANGKQVMLRGMSLYWSDATGIQYYNGDVLSWTVENLGIDVIRFAMGIQYYNSQGNASEPIDEAYSYIGSPDSYLATLDNMVEAAVKNDIYIIVDWHSHRAEYEQTESLAFFKKIAEKYRDIPNVIFEIYNEPVNTSWSTVQSYANTIAAGIRSYSQNLILVGTPNWSQLSSYGGVNATNIAYVLHFYAASHSASSYGSRATTAMSAGYPVFISEWGTTNADGDGSPSESATNEWITLMENNKISNCNWSLRQYTGSIDGATEQSAMFNGSTALYSKQLLSNATYTTSGTIVKNYLTKYKRSWADSLVAANHSGSCAFNSQSASETDGQISNALNSSCTYTSSDESVATASGSSIIINGAGFAIFTANDGSQSIVSIAENPKQTLSGFVDFTCYYGSNSCTQSKQIRDLTNNGSENEIVLSTTGSTVEGASVTLTSLNPSVVNVKKATCSNTSYCYGDNKNASVYMYEFSKAFGEAKIVATAPAATGYQALNDTITVTFAKGQPKIHSKFKSMTVALGSTTAGVLPDTTLKGQLQVTYLFNGELTSPYLSKSGNDLIAGNENAIVEVTGTVPESEYYQALSYSVTIIVGDSALAVNKQEYEETPIATKAIYPFRADLQNAGFMLQVNKPGLVEFGFYTAGGKKVLGKASYYTVGTHWISTENLPAGSYILKLKQGNSKRTLHWNKQ